MLRAPFPLHTCHRQYPGAAIAGTTLLFSRNDLSLPRIDWQVGPHITLFEACSAFTHVAACILAKSPSDPLHRRLQPLRYLHDCSGCFRREQKSPGGIRTRRKGATFSWRTSNSGDPGVSTQQDQLRNGIATYPDDGVLVKVAAYPFGGIELQAKCEVALLGGPFRTFLAAITFDDL